MLGFLAAGSGTGGASPLHVLLERGNRSLLLLEERLRPPGKDGVNGGHLWRLYHLKQKGEFHIRIGSYLRGPRGRSTA